MSAPWWEGPLRVLAWVAVVEVMLCLGAVVAGLLGRVLWECARLGWGVWG